MVRFYLTFVFILSISVSVFAKVLRVNNQETSNPEQNTFASLEEAYSYAVSGDTLYIEGSNISYGSLTIEKKIVLIGPGYFLSENEGETFHKQNAQVNRINFSNGSSGAKVFGLSVSAGFSPRLNINVDNIGIFGCYFPGSTILFSVSNLNDIVIHGCFFTDFPFSFGFNIAPPQNYLISNNIFQKGFLIKDNNSGTIVNNVIGESTFNVGLNSTVQIHNNILLGEDESEAVFPDGGGSNVSYNISVAGQFGNENGNQSNVTAQDIFILGETTSDSQYMVREGGPADGTGKDGEDLGPFGGVKPYKLSGVPDLPVVYDFSTSGFGTPEDQLPVQIKVRAK
ncbi:hypothetical protein QWY93_17610 [Echinicola jeungdonensis]|uniref:Right handed beta helix domain-containing protein n=1 Tax=Echinicola jeungdonensis TaxID=709343 RepID=A0ABV5J0I2_9BACT|nr:hypothetical protein [Echinicola jeungdonensis]MDN3671133.1 hypothetical protein [Echinicola jeungdonensis]